MSVARWQSRLACRWSVDLLFPSMEEAQLFSDTRLDLPHCWQSYGFLWTWTFPDERGQADPRYAMDCWIKHVHWLVRRGFRGVRAMERGSKSGHYHFHAVTDQRWDVNLIRAHAEKCGFGRIDVEEIPRDRIYYVAKYIGKPGRWRMPRGFRLWGCFGFSGVRAKDIRFRELTLTVPVEDVSPVLRSVTRWTLDGELLREYLLRSDWNGDPAEIHTMNITKENLLHIANVIATGAIIGVGEYRTCTARKLEFVKEGSDKKETRKLVEHGVEFGNEQVTVSEWLADDADLAAVKPAMNKGEACIIEIQNFSPKYGITAKSIKSIASFNGKLA